MYVYFCEYVYNKCVHICMHRYVYMYVYIYVYLYTNIYGYKSSSLLHLTCAIARAHARTRATSLMHEKIAHTTSVWGTYRLGH